MAQTITVTIMGLGRLGASVGLALQRHNKKSGVAYTFDVTGVEDRPASARSAEQQGAVSRMANSCCKQAFK